MIAATLSGRLGRAPEIRETQHGNVCSVSVAANYGYGENKITTWVKLEAWRKLGETLAKLDKGCRVVVAGQLYEDTWTDRDGEEHKNLKLSAEKIDVIDWPDQLNAAPAEASKAKPKPKPRPKPKPYVDEDLF